MHALPSAPLLLQFILTMQSKSELRNLQLQILSRFFLISWHTFRLEPNMVYLSENKKALIRTLFQDLDKHTYLMLQAKYKDKLNTSTEYYTL